MKKPEPILINDLMYTIDTRLIELLKSLSVDDWSKPTLASAWNIKDVAVHLLDGNVRSLSMLRDNYYGVSPGNITSYKDLIHYLNGLNADWVKAMKRLSPAVIIELLEITGREYCDFLSTLIPFDKATFPVAWAGENESSNWFHIAREYTEKWHHQQQIRFALGKSSLLLKYDFYFPYLDTSVRALPFHYRQVEGEEGNTIQFIFYGESDKGWSLKRIKNKWELYKGILEQPTCCARIPDDIGWRVFTKGIESTEAVRQSEIIGKKELALPIFDLIAVMA